MASIQPPPLDTAEPAPKLVAPLWHTILLVTAILGVTLLQARAQQQVGTLQLTSRLPLYFTQIVFELILFCYVWLLGLKLTGTPVRELVGGRWANLRDFWSDVRAAAIFWIIVAVVLLVLNRLVGQNETGLRAVRLLLPQNAAEMGVWVVVCITAGFCEEFVFRGYLQRQFRAVTGRNDWAIALQALIFGAAHGYQGGKGIIVIAIYGVMFGILAQLRKSLRPGMMQHAGQDIFSGILGSLLAKRHYF